MTRPHRSLPTWPRAVIALLLTAVLVNVAEFSAIEQRMHRGYAALTRQSSQLAESVTTQTRTSREGYGIYLALSEVAPGATLRLLPGLRLSRERAEGLGRVTVQQGSPRPVEPRLAERLEPFVVASGKSHVGPYVIAVQGVPATELVGLRLGEVVYLVDAELLEAAG